VGEHGIIAVVCHPHPQYGGTMHNKVVHRVASTLLDLGAAVLRFNFRGVGKSAGHFDQGEGELEDARAALGFMRGRYPGAREWLAGFSFGAWVVARLTASEPTIERLIMIAPPVRTSDFRVLRTLHISKWVFQGTADEICPQEQLEGEYARWTEPKALIKIEGANHFFDKQLGALSNALDQALIGAGAGDSSQTT
jgi:hypothetical protein